MKDKKIAVLIDSDNTQYKKLPSIMDELSTYGSLIVKRAYGDFSTPHLKNWKEPLNELAIQPQQQFAYTQGKNSTDSLMIIDAMDLLYSERFDTIALISSDSDFTSLATRLRASEIYVIGVGEKKTPTAFVKACDDFIIIENLDDGSEIENGHENDHDNGHGIEARNNQNSNLPDITTKEKQQKLWRLMHHAWQKYNDDDGWASLSEVGQYLKRIRPEFNPKNYGLSKLSDFFKKNPHRYETRTESNRMYFRFISKSLK